MWAYIKDGAIKQVNSVQTRLEINPGSYFPAKYANEWTKEQKEAYGVYEVVIDKTNYKDENYYSVLLKKFRMISTSSLGSSPTSPTMFRSSIARSTASLACAPLRITSLP